MKKVWILEKFATAEEQAKSYEDLKAMVETTKNNSEMTDEQIAQLEQAVANYKKVVDENPNGHWYGFEGKTNYKQFCDVAKAAIRRNYGATFRVVEGEINDNAIYWAGYEIIKVSHGVLRYLMATI